MVSCMVSCVANTLVSCACFLCVSSVYVPRLDCESLCAIGGLIAAVRLSNCDIDQWAVWTLLFLEHILVLCGKQPLCI
jgi:hypothetical protein